MTPLAWKRIAAAAACVGLIMAEAPHASAADRADFGTQQASQVVRRFADWVVEADDAHAGPFVIVDKVRAKVFVFNPDGHLRGAAPALLGLARGDDAAPGIGDRPLSAIRPEERTTPAGRFVADLGADMGEKDVLWVDYANAISLHRVVTTNPKEHRLQRLATPSTLDKRISYGCINVPEEFFDSVIHPAFAGVSGIVYVLPEVRSLQSVFSSYPPNEVASP